MRTMRIKLLSSFYIMLLVCVVSFIMLIMFLSVNNPREVGFLGTLIPLVLVWIFLLSFIRLIIATFNHSNSRLLRITSFIIPTAVVLGLMFSALGDVSVLEGLLLLVLAGLSNFYLARTWPK